MKKRESAVKEKMEDAKAKAKAGDSKAAIAELKQVVEQKCMFPGKAKDAVKELKKLGVTDVNAEAMPDGPNFDPAVSAKIQKTMCAGLKAENAAKYTLGAEAIIPPRTTLIPTIPRRCATWASCIATTRASGTRRARLSTRSWPCRPILFRAPWRCMGWAR